MQLILASQSVGRKRLLESLKIPFDIIPSTVDENSITASTPLETIKVRAKAKAENIIDRINRKDLVLENFGTKPEHSYLLLSADSGGIIGNELFGKPDDFNQAKEILKKLSGKTHEFVTAMYAMEFNLFGKVCELIWSKMYEDHSFVTFKKMTGEEIDFYLSKTDYTRYAASYALFTTPQSFIVKMQGSISNVVGLSLEQTIPLLQKYKLL